MIVKGIIAKVQNQFHVSVAEIDEQDIQQIIVIGVAAIVPHNAMADSLMDEISNFIEDSTVIKEYNCNLENSDLDHSNISGADFTGATLITSRRTLVTLVVS